MEIDLSRLDFATRTRVDEIFRKDFDLKVLKAIDRQTRIAAHVHRRPHRWDDDFGPQTMVVDPMIDAIWSEVYGANWREDPDKVRFLTGRNPEIKGRSVSSKIFVALSKFGGCTRRFSKSYN